MDTLTTDFVWPQRPRARLNEKAKAKANAKRNWRRRIVSNPIHRGLDPRILQRFSRALECSKLGIPIDYGFPAQGSVRFLASDALVPIRVKAHDRTLREWCVLIQSMIASTLQSEKQDADRLGKLFFKNQRLRWLAYKWIRNVRCKIMNKRVVGAEDMVTLHPIPTESLVSVYDIRARNKYQFHTNTIARAIFNNLMCSSYGIASPQLPKNPYTNVPWSYGQILTIITQVLRNQTYTHRAPSTPLLTYRMSNYNMTEFLKKYGLGLKIYAAKTLFSAHDDPTTIEIYNETIDDIYSGDNLPTRSYYISRLVKGRNISADLKKEWDALVLTFWLYTNYNIVILPARTYTDIDATFRRLHTKTLQWWNAQPRTVVRRRLF